MEQIREYLTKQAGGQAYIKNLRKVFKRYPMAKDVAIGGAAGAVATGMIMPVDTISDTQKQWRMTNNEPQLNRISKSFLSTAKELAHPKVRKDAKGGISPFYAGGTGKLMKVVPAMGMTFAAREHLERLLK